MTRERKLRFLEELRKHGIATHAANAASWEGTLGAVRQFKAEQQKDPQFAEAWADALAEADDNLLAEIRKRGLEGVEEDVFGSLGRGLGTGKVGTRKIFSDKMAELAARIQSKRVRDSLANKVELEQKVKSTELDMSKLTSEQLEMLKALLETQDDEAGEGDTQ
jgi:hypothetical protein